MQVDKEQQGLREKRSAGLYFPLFSLRSTDQLCPIHLIEFIDLRGLTHLEIDK